MAEYIECRKCKSPYCDGCNLYILATMLHARKLDDLMDEHRTIIETADISKVKHGRWIDHMVRDWRCSECGEAVKKVRKVDGYCFDDKPNFCPNCGADMRGE